VRADARVDSGFLDTSPATARFKRRASHMSTCPHARLRPSPDARCASTSPKGRGADRCARHTAHGPSPSPSGRGVGVRADARADPGFLDTSTVGASVERPASHMSTCNTRGAGPHPTRDARRPLPEGEVLIAALVITARGPSPSPSGRGVGVRADARADPGFLDTSTAGQASSARRVTCRPAVRKGPALTRRAMRVDLSRRERCCSMVHLKTAWTEPLSLRERGWGEG